ncbi:hypothetical protein DRP53_09290 [candidate division WOR-3 bacterium]|uniref:Uncharacterized protein n=1 Tax=candidate division WOR-3 bacterium TaxID=2052148 RepID=A0A660SEF3_UNCW3|nr:MAG: hypothetical protein DRP53_09290 [candidate division WOR-3 bacterium]
MVLILFLSYLWPAFNPVGRGYGLGIGPSNLRYREYTSLVGIEPSFGKNFYDLCLFPLPSIDYYQKVSRLIFLSLTSDYHFPLRDRIFRLDASGETLGSFFWYDIYTTITSAIGFKFELFRGTSLQLCPGFTIYYERSWTEGLSRWSEEIDRRGADLAPSLKGLLHISLSNDNLHGIIYSIAPQQFITERYFADTIDLPWVVGGEITGRIESFLLHSGLSYMRFYSYWEENFWGGNGFLSLRYLTPRYGFGLGVYGKLHSPHNYLSGSFLQLVLNYGKFDLAFFPFYERLKEVYLPFDSETSFYSRFGLRIEVGVKGSGQSGFFR